MAVGAGAGWLRPGVAVEAVPGGAPGAQRGRTTLTRRSASAGPAWMAGRARALP